MRVSIRHRNIFCFLSVSTKAKRKTSLHLFVYHRSHCCPYLTSWCSVTGERTSCSDVSGKPNPLALGPTTNSIFVFVKDKYKSIVTVYPTTLRILVLVWEVLLCFRLTIDMQRFCFIFYRNQLPHICYLLPITYFLLLIAYYVFPITYNL